MIVVYHYAIAANTLLSFHEIQKHYFSSESMIKSCATEVFYQFTTSV